MREDSNAPIPLEDELQLPEPVGAKGPAPAKAAPPPPEPEPQPQAAAASQGDVAAEKARLTKELARIDGEIEKAQTKLNNPNFTQKVPPAVLEEHQKRLADWQAKRQQVKSALDALG